MVSDLNEVVGVFKVMFIVSDCRKDAYPDEVFLDWAVVDVQGWRPRQFDCSGREGHNQGLARGAWNI